MLRFIHTLVATTAGIASAQTPAPVRMAPPARIVEFRVRPSSIQPGQSATLIWATENPNDVEINPGPGRVTARGSLQVNPKATTTYTLTVHGSANSILTQEITIQVAGSGTAAFASPTLTAVVTVVPRMADGKPDLTGVYNFSASDALGNARSARRVSFGPELKAGKENYRVVRPPNDPGVLSDCRPIAGPTAFAVPYPFQIVQSPSYVIIFHEFPGTSRIIPIGADHQADPDPTWLGESVGSWDQDNLVVDTIGFNTQTELSGFRHSEKLHIIERLSRPRFNTLHYEATLEDPEVFARPWTVVNNFPLRPELKKVDEFVCENNKDYSGYFEKK